MAEFSCSHPNGKHSEVLFETRHNSVIVQPVNVALMPSCEMAVLVAGYQFAEVRIYKYEARKYKQSGKLCVCQ